MTLIVAQPAADGVVMGSDSQITTGPIRTKTTKIHRLNDNALWGASGEMALIQRMAERIDAATEKDQSLAAARDFLGGVAKESLEKLLAIDFRTQFSQTDPSALLDLHPGDFLFVEYRDGTCHTLHVTGAGVAEWIDGRACSGSGAEFAHALLMKYESSVLTLEQARLLVFKIIEEAIEVGSWGMGRPIDIWDVSATGVHHCTKEEIAGLEDAARVLRAAEIELLEHHHAADAATAESAEAGQEPDAQAG